MRLCEECGVPRAKKCFDYDEETESLDGTCKSCRFFLTRRYRNKSAPPTLTTASPHIIHIDAMYNLKNKTSPNYLFIVKEWGKDVVLVGQGKSFYHRLNNYRQCFFGDLILLLALPSKVLNLQGFNDKFSHCHVYDNWYYYEDDLRAWILLNKVRSV